MLNFNTVDNTNAFSNAIPLHGGNFTEVPTSSPSSASVQVQQINLNYLNANTSGGDQISWSNSTVHNPTAVAIDNNCNRTTINNNNNLTHSNETVRIQQQKHNYLQTTIDDDQTNCRPPINMDSFLQQKGSENVKRFSVNNLLQLANNCRALVEEHRISSGKLHLVNDLFLQSAEDIAQAVH